jgi:hypothetical protein
MTATFHSIVKQELNHDFEGLFITIAVVLGYAPKPRPVPVDPLAES